MSKAARPDDTGRRPWHQDCRLREDVRMGSTGAAEFAADLQSVRTGKAPQVYADPAAFFARTYPTHNLRGLVRDVLLRLEGREGRPVLRLQVAYGGGKTHALLSLLHLAEHGRELASDPTVRQFLDFAGLQEAPAARVALLPFDQFDVEEGLTAYAPDGRSRRVRTPWGALAYQLGGDAGLARVARHEADYVSPAEPVLAELLGLPAAQGLATLVLVDEAVWYGSQAVHQDPRRLGVLRDFFQVLTQAATRQPRTALVATLVSSDVYAHDPTALSVLQALEAVFGRVTETAEPVVREDVAEILRRRLFEAVAPEAARRAATDAFFAALAGLPLRQAQTAQAAYDRMLASYPFHPDLIEVLYQKWSQLPGAGLQRTRGSLRLMALALRAAEGRDPGAWVGPGTLLGTGAAPSRALTELISHTAEREPWTPILTGELTRAAEVQATYPSLRARGRAGRGRGVPALAAGGAVGRPGGSLGAARPPRPGPRRAGGKPAPVAPPLVVPVGGRVGLAPGHGAQPDGAAPTRHGAGRPERRAGGGAQPHRGGDRPGGRGPRGGGARPAGGPGGHPVRHARAPAARARTGARGQPRLRAAA